MGVVIEPEGGESYDDLGFAVCRDLLRPDRVAAAAREAEAMFAAMPEGTGARLTCYEPGASPLDAMSRIDHPHLAGPAILTLIRDAALASSAAGLLRSRAVQVWYCHMSRKPPRNGSRTHIGWHQDGQYTEFMQGRFITAWIPLTDVDALSSPICYVPGSQHHGVIGGSGFSGAVDPETLKSSMLRRRAFDWNEIEVCAEPGTVVFHNSLVVHGSRENNAVRPRLTLTVHLRSERNLIAAIPSGRITLDQLRDGRTAPVIHGCREDFADMDGEWAPTEPRQC